MSKNHILITNEEIKAWDVKFNEMLQNMSPNWIILQLKMLYTYIVNTLWEKNTCKSEENIELLVALNHSFHYF